MRYRFLLLLCALLIGILQGSSQNVSGLLNKKLTPANDLTSLFTTGLGTLFGGKIDGKIDSVVVTEDSERKLRCKIYYNNFLNGHFTVSVIDAQQKTQNQISTFKFKQSAAASPAEVVLDLKNNIDEGFSAESAHLRIDVGKKENGFNFSTAFLLPKKWNKTIAPENLLQTIKLIPIGVAANLTEQKNDKLPPSVFKIDPSILKKQQLIYKPIKLNATSTIETKVVNPHETTTKEINNKMIVGESISKINTPTTSATTKPAYQKYILYRKESSTTVAQPDTKAKGPDELTPLNLIDEILVDPTVDFNFRDITSISTWNLYPDKNPNSGVYYFIPENFKLKWSERNPPEKGYNFSILYGTQRENTNANIRMASTLTSGVSKSDIDFIKRLLKAADNNFKELKMLPMDAPSFSFQSDLGSQYSIGSDKVSVQSFSDILSDMQVSWQTDADTKEFMQTSLMNHDGIVASVVLKPKVSTITPITIPAVINIGDPRILGKIQLTPKTWRTNTWTNSFPYPIKINTLHIIRKELNGTRPIVYSWNVGGIEVPSLSKIKFENNSIIPSWVDDVNESPLIWIDYDVLECSTCDEKVMDAITGGVSGSRQQNIQFTIPPQLFELAGVSYFIVNLRSIQADPNDKVITELSPTRVNSSAETTKLGPLYLKTDGTLNYEYKLTAATNDGDFIDSEIWVNSQTMEVLLGKTKLKEIFGEKLPGLLQ